MSTKEWIKNHQEDLKRFRREWYFRNKQHQLKKQKERTKLIVKWYNEYKSNSKCSVCGENHIACLEFHHRDSKTKENNISMMLRGWSIETIKKEISKCDVLCSNCHRKLHHKQEDISTG